MAIPAASLMPASYTANNTTPQLVGPIAIKEFARFWGHVQAGVLGTNSTVVAYFQGSNTNNGTFANIVANTAGASNTGATLTLNTSNTEGTVEIRADQMNAGNTYIQLCILVTANNSYASAELYATDCRYSPAGQFNASTLNTTTQPVT
jgi:hypothetical protein